MRPYTLLMNNFVKQIVVGCLIRVGILQIKTNFYEYYFVRTYALTQSLSCALINNGIPLTLIKSAIT